MEGICKMYEEHLKRMNPLSHLSCLVFREDTQTYKPYSREWIKERIYMLLSQQAQKAGT
ncbi:Enhancer of rudimentary homolog [Lemmus lemmus]